MKQLIAPAGILALATTSQIAAQEVVVHRNAAAAWGSVHLVEDLRIGAVDGAEEYTFGLIVDMDVGTDGTIAVLDGRPSQLRLYDASGKFIRNVGGSGRGPGEYTQAWGVRYLSDGRIAVWERGRLGLFDAMGEPLETQPLIGPNFATESLEVDGDGHFFFKAIDFGRGPVVPGEPTPRQWMQYTPGLELVDSIRIPVQRFGSSFTLATPQGHLFPFTRDVYSALTPNGELVSADNSEYAIRINHEDGTTKVIRRDLEPVSIGRGERAEWEAWAAHFAAIAGGDPVSIPRTKPFLRGLTVDADGRIWVDRYVEAEDRPGPVREPGDTRPRRRWIEPRTFDVITQDGELLATVIMPDDVYAFVRRGNHVWGVARDEFGVQYVVRLRIVRSG